ncbi:MAG: hypothetical protein ACWGQW_01890 [bacterium]
MPLVRLKVKALNDADVAFISLVGRPANRIPFRITKAESASTTPDGESSMFNLDHVVRKLDGMPTESGKLAAIVLRQQDLPKYETTLKAQGFSTDNRLEVDGAVILKQSEFDEKEVLAFDVGNNVAILMEHVTKAFEPYTESDNFKEVMGCEGFLPSLQSANEALGRTLVNILRKSESPEDAKTKLQDALGQFSSYVLDLTGNLPTAAFKLDLEKADDAPEDTEQTAGEASGEDSEEASGEAPGEAEGTAEDDPKGEKKTEEGGKPEASAEGSEETPPETEETPKEEGADTPEGKQETTEKGDDLSTLLKGMKDEMLNGLQGLREEIGEIKTTQKSLGERLDSVETVAKSAQSAVRRTVQSGSDTDEGVPSSRRKGDGDAFWDGTALDRIIG